MRVTTRLHERATFQIHVRPSHSSEVAMSKAYSSGSRSHHSAWALALALGVQVIVTATPAQAQRDLTAGMPPPPPQPLLVEVSQESGQRVYRLARAASVVGNLVCGTNSVIRVIPAADESPAKQAAEVATLNAALIANRKVVLADGRCGADGSLVSSGVSMQAIDGQINACQVPLPGQPAAGCGL